MPDLLSCIQTVVDQDPAPGRFVLTGSQNFLLMAKVGQTVAGDMLDGLRWCCALSGRPLEAATLVHGGKDRCTRGGVAVRPWFGV